MATARLRSAFPHPPNSDSEPDELDEEHQEILISTLQAEDAAKNDLYRKVFLGLPLAGALFFVYTLCFDTATAQQALITVLGITSLGCTSYILNFMPPQSPERPLHRLEAAKGPVEKYLVYLNAGLVALLLLATAASWRKGAAEEWRAGLAAMISGMALMARQQLEPVDLEELKKAKYDYKGA